MPTYRFKNVAVSMADLQNQIGSGTVSLSTVSPESLVDVTLSDAGEFTGLSNYMTFCGWEYVATDPAAVANRQIVQLLSTRVTSDQSAILPAASWTTVASQAITTTGDSVLLISTNLSANVLVGGGMRTTIFGGSFGSTPGTILQGVALSVLGGGGGAITVPLALPSTSSTTYTVLLQVRALGVLSSVTIDPATNPSTAGASIVLQEYR